MFYLFPTDDEENDEGENHPPVAVESVPVKLSVVKRLLSYVHLKSLQLRLRVPVAARHQLCDKIDGDPQVLVRVVDREGDGDKPSLQVDPVQSF